MTSEAIGTRTDEDSTNAIDPPSVRAAASARLSRTAPRKTLLERGLPGLVRGVRGAPAGRAAHADQGAVQPAELLPGRADQAARGGRVGVVGGQPYRPPGPEGRGRPRRGPAVAAAHHDPCPLRDQGLS